MTNKNIFIIKSSDGMLFQRKINMFLDDGWTIHGDTMLKAGTFYQVVIKEIRRTCHASEMEG